MINLEELDKQLGNADVTPDMDALESSKLWKGIHSVKVMDMQATTTNDGAIAYNIALIDEKGELMPSDFADQTGALFIRANRLGQFITSIRWIANLSVKDYPNNSSVIGYMCANYIPLHFVVKSAMKAWGVSRYNVIDFKQSAIANGTMHE